MTEVINPEDIKKTQNSLSKYIKEPPLTDKLLRKPPFRFLHDIIKSVIKQTGFLNDVFSPEDLNLDNIKDKEGKIAFLKKLIAAVKDATGSPISAKPNKIVAGLEVTKTLALLQAVGKGITLKLSGKLNIKKERSENKKNSREKNSTDKDVGIVKKVKTKKDEASEETKKKGKENGLNDKNKKVKLEKENTKVKEDAVNIKNDIINKEEEKKIVLKSDVNKPIINNESLSIGIAEQQIESSDVKTIENGSEFSTRPSKEESNENNIGKEEICDAENGLVSNTDEKNKVKYEDEEIKKTEKSEKRPSTRRQSSRVRPSSKTVGDNIKKDEENEKQDDNSNKDQKGAEEIIPLLGTSEATPISISKVERPTTARKAPPSARAPGIPKTRDRGEVKLPEIIDKEQDVKPVEVITEDLNQEDDKENMVVVETQPLSLDNDLQGDKLIEEIENETVGENEGALVAQILETKKELDETKQHWANTNQKNIEIEWETGKKQKRDSWEKEVNKLRASIQELTRTTNPLGKLFDFIQEDVDSMQRELKLWTAVNQRYKDQLTDEQKLTEITMEKYKKQLAEMDSLIEHEQEAVRNLKANIIANDQKIFNQVTRANLTN